MRARSSQAVVALVALLLLLIAVLGEIGRADVWTKQIGPQIEPKVVAIELDEQLRKDMKDKNERGILEIVRDVL